MGDARPHDGQPCRHVHRPSTPEQLHGDVAVIVDHRRDAVEFRPVVRQKYRIARDGTGRVNPLRLGPFHCGGDDTGFLVAEQSAVGGVRVERRHPDPRGGAGELRDDVAQQADRVEDRFDGDVRDRRPHRLVQRHMGHGELEFVVVQQHRVRFRPGAMGENFGMAGERDARGVQTFLVQRAGDDPIGAARAALVDGEDEPVERGPSRLGGNLPENDLRQIRRRRIEALDTGGQLARIADDNGVTVLAQLRPCRRDDLRADPGAIAHRDQQFGEGHGASVIRGR